MTDEPKVLKSYEINDPGRERPIITSYQEGSFKVFAKLGSRDEAKEEEIRNKHTSKDDWEFINGQRRRKFDLEAYLDELCAYYVQWIKGLLLNGQEPEITPSLFLAMRKRLNGFRQHVIAVVNAAEPRDYEVEEQELKNYGLSSNS